MDVLILCVLVWLAELVWLLTECRGCVNAAIGWALWLALGVWIVLLAAGLAGVQEIVIRPWGG